MNIEIKKSEMSPRDLDNQSPVKIDKWLDIGSEECDDKDPNPGLTKAWLKMGASDGYLVIDSLGRIWGRGDGCWYPYHFDYGKKNYGFRLAARAAN